MKLQLLFAVCLFNIYAECKWMSNNEITGTHHSPNEIMSKRSQYWQKKWEFNDNRDPPDHTKIIAMSRYVLHHTSKYFCIPVLYYNTKKYSTSLCFFFVSDTSRLVCAIAK